MQHLKRPLVSLDVELIAGRAVERTASVGADLGGDGERAQEAEGAASHGGVGHIQMYGYLAASAQMDASGRVEQPGELGESVAVVPGRYPRELVAEILRE